MKPSRLEKLLKNAAYFNILAARKAARVEDGNDWKKALHGDTHVNRGNARLQRLKKESQA